jgi:hypothetical protein
MMHVTKIKEQKGSYTIFTSKQQDESLLVREYRVNKEGSRWRLNRIGDTCGAGIIFSTLRQAVKHTARYDERQAISFD